jgi:large subunit ribosomal protein L25
MMSSSLQRSAIELARALPPRLQTFLARYPSPKILPTGVDPEAAKTPYQQDTPNPFLPTKHAVTGKWHDPVYSLRRQAEIVKLARENGVEELLPYTPKGTFERLQKRVELGLRVKGTGIGQKVKGHKHERQLIAKLVLVLKGVCVEWMLTLTAGWRRGGQLCSICRTLSGNGRRQVMISTREIKRVGMLTQRTGWQAELDQVPQVEGRQVRGLVRLSVHHVIIPVYFCPRNKVKLLTQLRLVRLVSLTAPFRISSLSLSALLSSNVQVKWGGVPLSYGRPHLTYVHTHLLARRAR